MLDKTMINRLFKELNGELTKKNILGEVGICGGAVMCLVYNARPATKDIDAIFEPTREIREACKKISQKFGITTDWLNDAVKGFLHANPPREDVFNLSHLRVWAPSADYMLAMKCISARFDSSDKDDIIFLIEHLNLSDSNTIFKIIEKYYPRNSIPAKTKFLIEEIMDQKTKD